MDHQFESDEEASYITTRSGVIQGSSPKAANKPDRLNGEYSYNSRIKQRVLGQPCIDCKLECDTRIAERFRVDNYLKFWAKLKTWEERRTHVRRLVQVYHVKKIRDRTRKKFIRKYLLEIEDGVTIVCNTMFFNTLAVSVKFLETTLKIYPNNIVDESKLKFVYSPAIIPKILNPKSYGKRKILTQENKNNKCTRKSEETSQEATIKKPIQVDQSNLVSTNIKSVQDISSKVKKRNNTQGKANVRSISESTQIMSSCCSLPTCSIPQKERTTIYEHFWKLNSWTERKLFISNTVNEVLFYKHNKNGHIETKKERSFRLPIGNEYYPVCQVRYLNTLSLNNLVLNFMLKTLPNENNEDYKNMKQKHLLMEKSQDSQEVKDNTSSFDYHNTKGVEQEFAQSSLPPCSCNLNCGATLTEYICQQIHKEFWNLPNNVDRKHFVLSTIQTKTFINNVTKVRKKLVINFYLPYNGDSLEVCKNMYLKTLSIHEQFVDLSLKNVNIDGSIVDDDDLNAVSYQMHEEPARHNITFTEPFLSVEKIVVGTKKCQNATTPKSYSEDYDFIDCSCFVESEFKEDALPSQRLGAKKPRKLRKRKLRPPCPSSCRYRCSDKLNEEQRKEIHNNFWCSMSWMERKKFVMDTIQELPIIKRTATSTLYRRNFSRKYTLPDKENKIIVCQKMYFNTLSLCSKTVAMVRIWNLRGK